MIWQKSIIIVDMSKNILPIGLFLLFTLLAMPKSKAQEMEEDFYVDDRIQISANLVVGVPIGAFREKVKSGGIGWGGSLLFMVNESLPVYAGIDLNGYNYDRESGTFLINIDGFWTNVEMETRTNVFTGHGLFRLAPRTSFFLKPYLDGMLGVKNLYTRTLFYDLDSGDDDPFDRLIEQGDWAFSYGGALGIKIPLNIYQGNAGLSIDLRCTYMKGAAADFLVRRDDLAGGTAQEPIDFFELKNAATDLLMPQIGIMITFGNYYEDTYPEEEY